jgi:hypothetical protein
MIVVVVVSSSAANNLEKLSAAVRKCCPNKHVLDDYHQCVAPPEGQNRDILKTLRDSICSGDKTCQFITVGLGCPKRHRLIIRR